MPLDRFSTQSAAYAQYRITYPAALYDWLLPQVPGRERAWDCATGNGQVAAALALHFAHIEATDLSANQLKQASALPNVHYQTSPAEHSPFADASFDLITVGQAVHWFDEPAWHREARRVLRPGGVLAEWGYQLCRLETPELNRVLDEFHDVTSAPYWDANRRHIADEYAHIAFPFAGVQHARFAVEKHWTAEDMLNYLGTWSATANYARQHAGADMVALVAEELTRLWGPGARLVSFPVFARAGVAR
ncbi:class I SAM-dependent methyltransferase [Hymenobacter sp. ASUV-10]|uniref:Class I SAM-dependent methyltransferase n=1 Tax=Hymenobacter aranciens TaxID=3063996 RepID=A0ABT9BGQ1_9BACT|nr:class I SAM-dependent methyltransferase [Hymenobacter sp. ASUV-10]MDO7875698.1 class I SAM-dependent methyltransferase [Hymenobacter sp. ASUV-10]